MFGFELHTDHIVQVGISVLCGAILGAEREIRGHPAGVRTVILITAGACIFMIVGRFIAEEMFWPGDDIRIDPGRLASYVIAGIGFLGAGPIIAQHGRVHGMTTAATIWAAAGIGLLVGIDRYGLALAMSIGLSAILLLLMPISTALNRRGTWKTLRLFCTGDAIDLQLVLSILGQHVTEVQEVQRVDGGIRIRARYRSMAREDFRMLSDLRQLEHVQAEDEAEDERATGAEDDQPKRDRP